MASFCPAPAAPHPLRPRLAAGAATVGPASVAMGPTAALSLAGPTRGPGSRNRAVCAGSFPNPASQEDACQPGRGPGRRGVGSVRAECMGTGNSLVAAQAGADPSGARLTAEAVEPVLSTLPAALRDGERNEAQAFSGGGTRRMSLIDQLELLLQEPWTAMPPVEAPTAAEVRQLVSRICLDLQKGGTSAAFWQQPVQVRVHLGQALSPRTAAVSRNPHNKEPSAARHRRSRPRLVPRMRPLVMVILEQCFASLLGHRLGGDLEPESEDAEDDASVACPGSTVVELVEALVQGGAVPDAALSLMLLEQLWDRGEQQQVVLLLALLQPVLSAASAAEGSPAPTAQSPAEQVSAGGEAQETASGPEDIDLSWWDCNPAPASLHTSSSLGPSSAGSASSKTLGSDPSQGSAASGAMRQAQPPRQNIREELRDRVLAQMQLQAEARQRRQEHALGFEAQAGDTTSWLTLDEEDESEGEYEVMLEIDEDDEWLAKEAAGEQGPVDLVLRVIQLAVERGQYRAALALPRRLRQDGVQLSAEAYDAALLAVVKEQELIMMMEQELRELQRAGQVQPMAPADQLLVQLYSATIRSEGQAILSWALEEIQASHESAQAGLAAAQRLLGALGPDGDRLLQELDPEHSLKSPSSSPAQMTSEPLQSLGEAPASEAGAADPEAPAAAPSEEVLDRGRGSAADLATPGKDQGTEAEAGAPGVEAEEALVQGLQSALLAGSSLEAGLHEKMLALWCLAGDGARAEDAMWRLAEAGRGVSLEVLAAVLGTCSFKGNLDALNRVVSRMEALGHKPDSAIFTLMVAAAMRGGHLQVAAAAMLSMVERGLSPDRQQMATLLRMLQREGHVESYLILSSSLSAADYVGPCLVFLYLDFIKFCIIRML